MKFSRTARPSVEWRSISTLLKVARFGAAAIVPAVVLFALASDDLGGYNADWVLYLVPVALIAVVAVGCLDGLRGVVPAALCCGVIFSVTAYLERDDRPLPQCKGLMDFGCKNDARPLSGIDVAIWVFVGGGAAALIAGGCKKLYASTDAQ